MTFYDRRCPEVNTTSRGEYVRADNPSPADPTIPAYIAWREALRRRDHRGATQAQRELRRLGVSVVLTQGGAT